MLCRVVLLEFRYSTEDPDEQPLRRNLIVPRTTANRVGRFGEELTNSYLSQLKNVGEIDDFEWVSNENVVAPYDFKLESFLMTLS